MNSGQPLQQLCGSLIGPWPLWKVWQIPGSALPVSVKTGNLLAFSGIVGIAAEEAVFEGALGRHNGTL